MIKTDQIKQMLSDMITREEKEQGAINKILILPPDHTRAQSGAGVITGILFEMLHERCEIDIMPALGTHVAMSKEECMDFFGKDIPYSHFIAHNWKEDVVKIGEIPAAFVKEVSEGIINEKIDVEVNKRLLDKTYDLVLSIGQVVPHEVVGMANYSKNIFVGCGGNNMINSSHMLGAFYGIERIMGKDFSPVRKVLDYGEEHFIKELPIRYIMTVTTQSDEIKDSILGTTVIEELWIGRGRKIFEEAVSMSQEKNLTYVDKPLKKVIVRLDDKEFKSTWLGNKAIYRTRMAMANEGELIILAPGVCRFGEDMVNDGLIRKYGYVGREKVLELVKINNDLKENLSAAAHLIHGSSDGRFHITYAVSHLTKQEIEDVGFKYADYDETEKQYDAGTLENGWNTLANGEEVYYIDNPAIGLWSAKEIGQ